jgi:hypothetical protein
VLHGAAGLHSGPVNWRLVLWWTTAIGLAAWVTLHVAVLVLVQVPVPVLPAEARRAAMAYVDPIFRQSWWLFSPNPPAFDRAVYARGVYETTDGQGQRTAQETPWLALSEPLLLALHQDRLTLRDGDLTVMLHGMYSLSELLSVQMSPVAREQLFAIWSDPSQQPSALVALERAGSAALAAAHPDLPLQRVQVRLMLRRLPSFEERAQPVGEPDIDVTFPLVPFQDVVPWSPGG